MPGVRDSELAHLGRIRQEFLDVAVEIQPELVTALRGALSPARRRWWPSKGRLLKLPSNTSTEYTPPEVLDALRTAVRSEARVVPFPPFPPAAPVLPEIARWAERFGLQGSKGSWVEQAATVTLYRWQLSGRVWKKRLIVAPTSFGLEGPSPRPFGFSYHATSPGLPIPRFWFPPAESWEDFKRDVQQDVARALEIHLDLYKQRIRKRFDRAGWTPLQRKRKRKSDHYRWTVLYQVRGWSFSEIAKRELGSLGDSDDPARRKIEDAVTRTARSLGLKLRPARKGPLGRER